MQITYSDEMCNNIDLEESIALAVLYFLSTGKDEILIEAKHLASPGTFVGTRDVQISAAKALDPVSYEKERKISTNKAKKILNRFLKNTEKEL